LEAGRVGETYNIGGLNEKTNVTVVHAICDRLDSILAKDDGSSYHSQIIFVKDRVGHDKRYAIDATKILRELDWFPRMGFEEGLQKTVAWYLTNQPWVQSITSGTYRHWIESHYTC
jgi:dTDP-glucose 4,6-dehydratase